jgi:F-type H+-transporting ATPase subunit a
MIGFLPLPTNTEHTVDVFGSSPVLRDLRGDRQPLDSAGPHARRLVSYHVEGIRAKGFFSYLQSWLPPGLEDMNPIGKAVIFVIEAISHFAA